MSITLEARRRYEQNRGPRSPEFGVWRDMIQRCHNFRNRSWKRYGGRGIVVCTRWRGPGGFANFFADMGPRPSRRRRYTIERRNNNLGYTKSNCKWAVYHEQARNKCNNLFLTFRGRTMCLTDWANEVGLNISTLYYRVARLGWTISRALTEAVNG
jgi:hypothetical protein